MTQGDSTVTGGEIGLLYSEETKIYFPTVRSYDGAAKSFSIRIYDIYQTEVTLEADIYGLSVATEVNYDYDAFNQLVHRSFDADGPGSTTPTHTYYSYDDGQVVLQWEQADGPTSVPTLSHRYLWGPAVDQLIADEKIGGDLLWALADRMGTVRDLATHNTATNTTTIVNGRNYDSFGNLTSETNSAIDEIFGYTGRMFDEATGLQNNLNRWYDPQLGRWISEDPIGFAAGDPNLNRYVGNDPVNYTDPSGLEIAGPGYNPYNYSPPRASRLSPAWQAYRRAMFNYTMGLIRQMMIEGDKLFRSPCAPQSTIDWTRLESAMFYFLNEYGDFDSWSTIDLGDSYNVHPFVITGWLPLIIDPERLDKDTASSLGSVLIHEPMHDWMSYGFDINWLTFWHTREHHKTIDKVIDDYFKLITLLQKPDCTGSVPWDRIMDRLGPEPTTPRGPKFVP